jgi:hypothetical protein
MQSGPADPGLPSAPTRSPFSSLMIFPPPWEYRGFKESGTGSGTISGVGHGRVSGHAKLLVEEVEDLVVGGGSQVEPCFGPVRAEQAGAPPAP